VKARDDGVKLEKGDRKAELLVARGLVTCS
jgi:hypothetical protein